MNFLLDENFPKSAERLLVDAILARLCWIISQGMLDNTSNRVILLRDSSYRTRETQ